MTYASISRTNDLQWVLSEDVRMPPEKPEGQGS